jgi:hypothetical protein
VCRGGRDFLSANTDLSLSREGQASRLEPQQSHGTPMQLSVQGVSESHRAALFLTHPRSCQNGGGWAAGPPLGCLPPTPATGSTQRPQRRGQAGPSASPPSCSSLGCGNAFSRSSPIGSSSLVAGATKVCGPCPGSLPAQPCLRLIARKEASRGRGRFAARWPSRATCRSAIQKRAGAPFWRRRPFVGLRSLLRFF